MDPHYGQTPSGLQPSGRPPLAASRGQFRGSSKVTTRRCCRPRVRHMFIPNGDEHVTGGRRSVSPALLGTCDYGRCPGVPGTLEGGGAARVTGL